MDRPHSDDRTARRLAGSVFGVLVAVAVAACTGQAVAADPPATLSTATASCFVNQTGPAAPVPACSAPVAVPAQAGSGSGTASTGVAYVYPYYVGSAGVAPDHSILVTGSGTAELKADDSNHAADEHAALLAAVADAKARADAVAAATGCRSPASCRSAWLRGIPG
jgi:hypothetical protein